MTETEQAWLVALQRGLPLEPRPFEALSRELDCGEADLLAFLARCRAAGLVRRFGAIFDARRLGYRSVLCCAKVPSAVLAAAAAAITPLPGVTHCYERVPVPPPASRGLANIGGGRKAPGSFPNLWFTLSEPAESFDAAFADVRARLAPHVVTALPATRRYKVDVVFGAATRAREESVEAGDPLSATDRRIIGALQGDVAAAPDFFAAVATAAGIPEWKLLARLEIWRRSGRLKRVGLVLAHRNAGYTANGMCCWRVDGDTTAVGRALAARPEVTHCYERPLAPDFPYNIFAMIHETSTESAAATFAALEAACALAPGVMLLSTTEYKKTSMTFFAPSGPGSVK